MIVDDDSDIDDLLGSDTEEEEKTKRSDAILPEKKVAPVPAEKKKYVLDLNRSKEQEREQEQRRRRERERLKERREQRAKPYSRTELRKEMETVDKEKIRQIAQQLKQENKGRSITAGLGRIPKLPKKVNIIRLLTSSGH